VWRTLVLVGAVPPPMLKTATKLGGK